jgi:hypothetical protein
VSLVSLVSLFQPKKIRARASEAQGATTARPAGLAVRVEQHRHYGLPRLLCLVARVPQEQGDKPGAVGRGEIAKLRGQRFQVSGIRGLVGANRAGLCGASAETCRTLRGIRGGFDSCRGNRSA